MNSEIPNTSIEAREEADQLERGYADSHFYRFLCRHPKFAAASGLAVALILSLASASYAARTGPIELEPLKPDLIGEMIQVVPQVPGRWHLYVDVRNRSDVASAKSTTVDASVDGRLYRSVQQVPPLMPEQAWHTFVAEIYSMPCEVEAVIDPDNTIDELNEDNNRRIEEFPCSSPTPTLTTKLKPVKTPIPSPAVIE